MQFFPIDVVKHRDIIVNFRKDSFFISFGNAQNFDQADYLDWVKEKTKEFPKGFVLVEEKGKFIGQLELSIREYEGQKIGYVHLYYLIPEMRGKGKGAKLHEFAKQFFFNNNVKEYHLRVSPSNSSAIQFYKKIGMEEIGPEVKGRVIRMRGYL